MSATVSIRHHHHHHHHHRHHSMNNHFHPSDSRRSTSISPQPGPFYPHSSSSSSSSSLSYDQLHHQQQLQAERDLQEQDSNSNSRKRSLTTASTSYRSARSQPTIEDEEVEEEDSPHSNNHLVSGNKRTRKLLTPEQSQALHALLQKTRFPSTSAREEIAKQLNITPRKVQVFFQNKRQKARRHTLSKNAKQAGEPSTSSANAGNELSSETSLLQGRSPPRGAPVFGNHSLDGGDYGVAQSYPSYSRDGALALGQASYHQRETSRHSSNPSSHQLHPLHPSHQQVYSPSQYQPQLHSHAQGRPLSSSSSFSPELGSRSLHQSRSFHQYPASLSAASGVQVPGSSNAVGSVASSFPHLTSPDSRRRAFSDAPHRFDPPSSNQALVGTNVWDDKTSQLEAAPRRLAPLPQGRRIELPPIPAGLAAPPNPISSPIPNPSSTSRLSSPPLPPIFSSALPPLRLNSRLGRRQEEEDNLTDEERSNSSKASSQAESIDNSLVSRVPQHPREGSLPASPFPHLLNASPNVTSRGRSDSDPFFRERAAGLRTTQTPPVNELERSSLGHGHYSSRGSLSPVTTSSSRPVSIAKLSQSQDSGIFSSQDYSSFPSSQFQHRPLPPISSGLATSTPASSSQYQEIPSQSQFHPSSQNSNFSQPPKRPTEALRLPSFSQLSIDVESRDRQMSQEMKRVPSGGTNVSNSQNGDEHQ